jgi:2-polyprenyl-6-hydroxyphenyl methylase/3-demethylubiquinone-9 3-methyltransferase
LTALYEAEVRARFDALHRRFKREVPADDIRLTAIVAALPQVRGARILDVGCGKGRFAARLAERGARVVGVDISEAMLTAAEGLTRVRAASRRLPFADASFDCAMAVEVLEHLPSVEATLAELRRVVRPGGVIAIVDKNAGSLNADRPWLPNVALKWLDEYRGRWMYPRGGLVHERWFWPSRLRRQLQRSFVDVRVAHVLSPSESRWVLFRAVPGIRLFTLWSARVPGGS